MTTFRPQALHFLRVDEFAVTLVIDYGVCSETEGSISREGSAVGFEAGVSAQSGTLGDTATIVEYRSRKSSGLPAVIALAISVAPKEQFAQEIDGANVVVKAGGFGRREEDYRKTARSRGRPAVNG
jgi:hypothetical protein